MANHIINVLTFKKLTLKEKEFILNNFTSEIEDDIYPLNKVFDFDKIIPEPRKKEDCPDHCIVHKDSHIMEDKDRPWFDWYAWHIKYWGTKWNAYDGYVKITETTIKFVFHTAWCIPLPIYEQLAKNEDLDFTVKYADEDLGSNCGILTKHRCDTVLDSMVIGHPQEFAEKLWDRY